MLNSVSKKILLEYINYEEKPRLLKILYENREPERLFHFTNYKKNEIKIIETYT